MTLCWSLYSLTTKKAARDLYLVQICRAKACLHWSAKKIWDQLVTMVRMTSNEKLPIRRQIMTSNEESVRKMKKVSQFFVLQPIKSLDGHWSEASRKSIELVFVSIIPSS